MSVVIALAAMALEIDQFSLSPRFVAKICDIPQTRRRGCPLCIKNVHMSIRDPWTGQSRLLWYPCLIFSPILRIFPLIFRIFPQTLQCSQEYSRSFPIRRFVRRTEIYPILKTFLILSLNGDLAALELRKAAFGREWHVGLSSPEA